MRVTVAAMCGVLFIAQVERAPAQTFAATRLSARHITEVSAGHATRKAERGELLEVRAQLTIPAAGATLPVDSVKLAGSSAGTGTATQWWLAPIAVGAPWQGHCGYEFPDMLVTGGVGFGGNPSTLVLRRTSKGTDAFLEFPNREVELCAVFAVPSGATGSLHLNIGGAAFAVPWVDAR